MSMITVTGSIRILGNGTQGINCVKDVPSYIDLSCAKKQS